MQDARATTAHIRALVDLQRLRLTDLAARFGWTKAELDDLRTPSGWHWIEFRWFDEGHEHFVRSGWLTAELLEERGSEVVDQVLQRMVAMVEEVGTRPSWRGQQVDLTVRLTALSKSV